MSDVLRRLRQKTLSRLKLIPSPLLTLKSVHPAAASELFHRTSLFRIFALAGLLEKECWRRPAGATYNISPKAPRPHKSALFLPSLASSDTINLLPTIYLEAPAFDRVCLKSLHIPYYQNGDGFMPVGLLNSLIRRPAHAFGFLSYAFSHHMSHICLVCVSCVLCLLLHGQQDQRLVFSCVLSLYGQLWCWKLCAKN